MDTTQHILYDYQKLNGLDSVTMDMASNEPVYDAYGFLTI